MALSSFAFDQSVALEPEFDFGLGLFVHHLGIASEARYEGFRVLTGGFDIREYLVAAPCSVGAEHRDFFFR